MDSTRSHKGDGEVPNGSLIGNCYFRNPQESHGILSWVSSEHSCRASSAASSSAERKIYFPDARPASTSTGLRALGWSTFHIDPRVPSLAGEISQRYLNHKLNITQLREQYIQEHMDKMPAVTSAVTNPNKSRSSKVYSPEEAAKRAKNNAASRESRAKRKLRERYLQLSLEFNEQMFADMEASSKFISDDTDRLKQTLNQEELTKAERIENMFKMMKITRAESSS